MFVTRASIIKDAQKSAEEIARDIVEDLKSVPPDADDRDLEEKLLGYLNRHLRIVRLDLYVYREAYTPSSRIAAPYSASSSASASPANASLSRRESSRRLPNSMK